MKLLAMDELPDKGIRYHPQHIRKLIKAGLFPRPIRPGVEVVMTPMPRCREPKNWVPGPAKGPQTS